MTYIHKTQKIFRINNLRLLDYHCEEEIQTMDTQSLKKWALKIQITTSNPNINQGAQ